MDLSKLSDADLIDLYQKAQVPNPGALGTAGDVAASAGIGAVKGTLGLADIPQLIESGLNWGNQKLVDRGLAQPRDQTPVAPMPSSAAAQKGIESFLQVPFYKPKTYAGEWAETVGEFAPAAVGGPGSLATRLATRAAAPAVASEGAGHLTQGTKAEIPSRIGAALLAGPAASRAIAPRALPSGEQLQGAATKVWNDPAVRGTPAPANAPTDLGARVLDRLEKANVDELNAPLPFKRAEYIGDMQNPNLGNIHAVGKKLGEDAKQQPASYIAKREVDQYLGEIDPRYKDANANYAAGMRSDTVTGKLDDAAYGAMAANSGKNTGNKTRQMMESIRKNEDLHRGFSPDEMAQLEKTIKGGFVANRFRDVGNMLGGGGGVGQTAVALGLGGGGGAYASGGDPQASAMGAMAAILAGRGAKGIEAALTRRQANQLDEMIRSRAPLARGGSMPLQIDPENIALIRALLGTSGANQGAR